MRATVVPGANCASRGKAFLCPTGPLLQDADFVLSLKLLEDGASAPIPDQVRGDAKASGFPIIGGGSLRSSGRLPAASAKYFPTPRGMYKGVGSLLSREVNHDFPYR